MQEIAIGVDIGGTNTAFGLVSENGTIISKNSIITTNYKNINDYIQKLSSEIKLLLKKETDIKVKGIGIGAPNGNIYNGTIEYAPNLEWQGVINLTELMQKHFSVPIWLTNDANAAAYGEMMYGNAKNIKDFIFITIGTGLGSGIVSNGKLIYGHDGFAGEMGHVIVKKNGRECNCGKKGCLETYVSANGIKRTVFELLSEISQESELRNISYNELSSKQIYEFAKKGDKIALKAFDKTAEILGRALSNAVAFTSPQVIFLFGGITNAKDLLIKQVKLNMEKNLLKIYKNKIKIRSSQFKAEEVAILGASAIVWCKNSKIQN